MTRLLVVVVLVACSGRAPAPTRPDEPRGSADVIERGSGSSGSTAAVPVETKVTEAECHAMIDHLIDVDLEERPADQQLGPDQKAEVAAQLRKEGIPTCMQQPRAIIACITAAPTRAAITACQ